MLSLIKNKTLILSNILVNPSKNNNNNTIPFKFFIFFLNNKKLYKSKARKIKSFCKQFYITSANSKYTHFTETRSSTQRHRPHNTFYFILFYFVVCWVSLNFNLQISLKKKTDDSDDDDDDSNNNNLWVRIIKINHKIWMPNYFVWIKWNVFGNNNWSGARFRIYCKNDCCNRFVDRLCLSFLTFIYACACACVSKCYCFNTPNLAIYTYM